jgi:hypothetical protein
VSCGCISVGLANFASSFACVCSRDTESRYDGGVCCAATGGGGGVERVRGNVVGCFCGNCEASPHRFGRRRVRARIASSPDEGYLRMSSQHGVGSSGRATSQIGVNSELAHVEVCECCRNSGPRRNHGPRVAACIGGSSVRVRRGEVGG